MRAAVSILLATLLTVHSVGGLCWQCADVQAGCPISPVATSVCNCHRPAEPTSECDIVAGSDSCCEFECTGTCRYLHPTRVAIEQRADAQWVALDPLDLVAIPVQSVFDIFERGAIARGGHPPLRLHLFHGLLLI